MRCAHYTNPALSYIQPFIIALARVECRVGSSCHSRLTVVLTNTNTALDCFLDTDNTVDDAKRERKRKEIAGRLGREMGEHRDECVFSFFPPSSIPFSI